MSASSLATNGMSVTTAVVRLMRWINSTEPSAKPTTIASVRLRKIVSKKVAASTVASPQPERSRMAMAGFSIMFQATTASTPARAAKRNIGRKRCGDQHEQQEENGVEHPRDGPVRPCPDVRGGPRDGPRDTKPAEERRTDIGRALCDEFAVRTMPSPRHAIGDDSREQRTRSRRAA